MIIAIILIVGAFVLVCMGIWAIWTAYDEGHWLLFIIGVLAIAQGALSVFLATEILEPHIWITIAAKEMMAICH